MSARRAAFLVIVVGAIAAWIAAAATSTVREVAPVVPVRPPAIDASGAELAAEIARLRDRLRPSATPTHGRDLFQFAAPRRTSSPQVAQTPVVVAPPQPAPVQTPNLTLIGIAQDGVEGSIVRTAIISSPGQLFMAKEGDEVASAGLRFRVKRISNDSAELAGADDGVLRLALK